MTKIDQLFRALWNDVQSYPTFPEKRPLLAHYTSIEVLEKILQNNEIWLSNPLNMNDIEEIRFGVNEGANLFLNHEGVKSACKSKNRYNILKDQFYGYFERQKKTEIIDTYVLCFSEHSKDDDDGLLSMWRGYGDNGKGVALIIDTEKMPFVDGSPIIISKVVYASTEERKEHLQKILRQFVSILKNNNIPDDQLFVPAYHLIKRFLSFALFTKHRGFLEEKEWRVVYSKADDKEGQFVKMLDYFIGKSGLEPKFKLKFNSAGTITETNYDLSSLVDKIIVGPSANNPLTEAAIKRMLEKTGNPELASKVKGSTTPYRII